MKSGQFVVGMIDGSYESYDSNNLSILLSPEELQKLWELAEKRGTGSYDYINYDERVIARTTITETKSDTMGRKGKVNHTVIFKFDKTVTHDFLQYNFDPETFRNILDDNDFKEQLNTPFPNELHNPLPQPKIEKVKQ